MGTNSTQNMPRKKKKTVPFESQKSEGNKVDKEPEVDPNLVEVLVFERIEDDMLKMEKLKMEMTSFKLQMITCSSNSTS